MTPKEMREKAARLITEARAKRDEITASTDESRSAEIEGQFNDMITEAENLRARADNFERLDALEAAGDARRPTGDETRGQAAPEPQAISYREAFHALMQAGGDVYALTPEVRGALRSGHVDLTAEHRAQVASTPAAGGNLVPDEAMREIVRAMAAWGPMFDDGFATVLNTTSGASLPIPGVDDIAKEAEANAAEGQALTDDGGKDVLFSKFTLDDHMIDTEWLRVSLQLMTGAMPDVEALLGSLLGERLGRKANKLLTVGTGTGEAQGIVTGATASGVAVAGVNAITSDELVKLFHSVDPAYRASPKFGFMFNDNTLAAIHMLRDGDGRYLVDEAPDGAGRIKIGAVRARYTINQAMADMAANARSIVVGDMAKYFVRKIGGVVIGTDRSAQFWPNMGIAGYTRFDGAVADPRAIKALVHPAA